MKNYTGHPWKSVYTGFHSADNPALIGHLSAFWNKRNEASTSFEWMRAVMRNQFERFDLKNCLEFKGKIRREMQLHIFW